MKTSEALEKLIEKGLEYLNSTEVFLKEQIPDYLKQVIKWRIIISIYWLIVSLVAGFFSYKAIKHGFVLDGLDNYEGRIYRGEWKFFGGVGAFFSFIMFSCCADSILKCLLVPKVFLVEYLSNLRGEKK